MSLIQKLFLGDSDGVYASVNKELLAECSKKYDLDGEILFLAGDPDSKVRGIGTFLVEELRKRKKQKRIYLYTDDFCSYQFYEHRGFEKCGEKELNIKISGEMVNMKCFIYSTEL